MRRWKPVIQLLMAAFVLVAVLPAAPAAAAITLVVNGKALSPDVPPQLVEGRTVVPLRFIGEALNMEVLWDDQLQAAVLRSEGLSITLPVGQREAIVNGKVVTLDVPAITIEGRTMVPVRFISEQLGARVGWDGENQVVSITTTEAPVAGDGPETVPGTVITPADPTTLSGAYQMTGEVALLFPTAAQPQSLAVSGWFDLVVEADERGYRIYKRAMEGSMAGLVLPEMLAAELAPDGALKPAAVSFALLPEQTQTGSYNPETGEFWMVTTLSFTLPDLAPLGGETYTAIALERGTLNPVTAAYSSQVSLTVVNGPFAGTLAIFSKGGSREDSLEDIRRLLEKESLTDEERERVERYLRESHASEADKIRLLRDLIELAEEVTGETFVLSLDIIDAIIAGIEDIEEKLYQAYKQMRDEGIIDGPEDFPNGTLEQRRKYEMRYLLEQLRRRLQRR